MNPFQRQLLLDNGWSLADECNAQGGSVPLAAPMRRVSFEEFAAGRDGRICMSGHRHASESSAIMCELDGPK